MNSNIFLSNKPSLLIVDDDERNLKTTQKVLQKLDIIIHTAISGEEALTHIINTKYFLILMDVQMPDMDGFETLRLIRSHDDFKYIPVIFLTAINKEDKYVKKGYKEGAVDYIFKPFNVEILISKINIFLQIYIQKQSISQHTQLLEELVQDRIKAEDKAYKAQEIAEYANQCKSEFLSNMSHELRTPLNAILGFSQLLQLNDDNLNQEQQANVNEILSAGKHLLGLIDEILNLSQIESGKIEILIEEVDLDDVLKQCLSLIKPQIDKQQLELIDNISNKEYRIQADFLRIKQVLLNLLSNAIKYNSEHGHIILDSEIINTSRESQGKQSLRISVTDKGDGLSKEDIARLFSPFVRFNVKVHIEGTGIGLVITKKLVELMDGSIGITSAVGEGSTFWVELPLSCNK
ncbi:MAG: response regulator [gamma proteobacterium symbiont of Taylorina sp.]|nr:response regulator [gamma proteobacterium symbiont of Taylorina sp.]